MTRPTLLNYVTCPFGKPGSWMAGYHTGIDYRAPVGTRIFATRAGIVKYTGTNNPYGSAYGNVVIIESRHQGRNIQHLYAHLSSVNTSPGKRVRAGDCIGRSGVSGNVFGAHLHYEERVYPFKYADHIKPILPKWRPGGKKWLNIVLRKIGVRK